MEFSLLIVRRPRSIARMETRVARLIAITFFLASAVPMASQVTGDRPVWFWFATCGGPLMTLEVQLDSRVVHKSTFPLCRSQREAMARQGQDGRLEFRLIPGRNVVWSGYRDTDERTAANEEIDVNIWEAGADPDTMTLGVSVVAGERIVMNTVHIAPPDKRSESAIATGLVVRTYPATK